MFRKCLSTPEEGRLRRGFLVVREDLVSSWCPADSALSSWLLPWQHNHFPQASNIVNLTEGLHSMLPPLSPMALLPMCGSQSVCPCCVNLGSSQLQRKIHVDRCPVTFVFPRYASRLVSIKREASSQGRDLLSRDEIQTEIDKVNVETPDVEASECNPSLLLPNGRECRRNSGSLEL